MSRRRPGPESLFRGDFLELKSRDGWEFVSRHRSSGVVALLAINDKDELLLVEQYRPPVDARVLEPPAGLVGDGGNEGELLEVAARRELVEETGYEAGELLPLFVGPSSAGLTSETIHFFSAHALEKVGEGGGDETEEITVHPVPIAEAHDFVAQKMAAGVLIDPKVWAVLYFAVFGSGS